MNLAVPCSLQISLFLMIVIGIILRKKNCIDDAGRQCLTNLCIQIIIPCNIVKSCLTPLGSNVLKSCGKIFAVGFLMQLVCLWFNAFLFRSFPSQRKKVLQYCTIVSNGGFLGNPVAEGIYGSLGLLYASVFSHSHAYGDVVCRHFLFCRTKNRQKSSSQKCSYSSMSGCCLYRSVSHGQRHCTSFFCFFSHYLYRKLQCRDYHVYHRNYFGRWSIHCDF